MKTAGYANKKHKWNNRYLAYWDWLRILQGKEYSISDSSIRATLRKKYKIQLSDEEMIKFSNYLTSLDPAYPSGCKLSYPELLCIDSKEYYEAYLRFKATQLTINH